MGRKDCIMANYAKHVSRKVTPQNQKAAKGQKKNAAGGFTFVIDDWQRLDRFLILGAEGGTFYVGENKLVKENAKCVEKLLKSKKNGLKVVQRTVEISQSGRAAKNDPAIFVLALAASCDKDEVRKAALEALPQVCRTGTHLFHFASMVNELRGWGRGLRKAVANWYNSKDPDRLAYQLVKYQQRDGWSNKDLLRLSHAGSDAPTESHQAAYRWVVAGDERGKRKVVRQTSSGEVTKRYSAVAEMPRLIEAYEQIKSAKSEKKVVKLIREHRLTHEMVPNEFKNSKAVWEALLENMPVTAMIRNLGKLTNIGLIMPLSKATNHVVDTVTDLERLKKARVHPLQVLTALKIYQQGHGMRGSLSWSPNQKVADALDDAFYLAFDAVDPTGKNQLIAIDASGSMGARFAGSPVTCAEAAAAMAMVTARTEKNHHMMYFSSGGGRGWGYRNSTQSLDGIADLNISPKARLDAVVRNIAGKNWGGTDCSLPMLWADHNKADVDAFIVLTDNDTWAGAIHPHQALVKYRKSSGRDAKLVVVGMTATRFSIANPNDAGMMDVVGFDAAAPALIANFIRE